MEWCKCYSLEYNAREGYISRCDGTKERDVCSCRGDKSKCDFYEYVRNKANKIFYNTKDQLDKLSVGIIYTIKKSNGNKNAIIDYLCKETWSAREVYTDKVLLQCLRNAWCDLLDKVKYPSSLMREYYHMCDYPWNKDELEALISCLATVQVCEKNEDNTYKYINGFYELEDI